MSTLSNNRLGFTFALSLSLSYCKFTLRPGKVAKTRTSCYGPKIGPQSCYTTDTLQESSYVQLYVDRISVFVITSCGG